MPKTPRNSSNKKSRPNLPLPSVSSRALSLGRIFTKKPPAKKLPEVSERALTLGKRSEKIDAHPKSNTITSDNSAMKLLKPDPELAPMVEAVLSLEPKLSQSHAESLSRGFAKVVEAAVSQQDTSLLWRKKRAKYPVVRGRGTGDILKPARWLVENWADLLATGQLYQCDLGNADYGDPKLLQALRNACKKGMLEAASTGKGFFHAYGLQPPYKTLRDILPTEQDKTEARLIQFLVERLSEESPRPVKHGLEIAYRKTKNTNK